MPASKMASAAESPRLRGTGSIGRRRWAQIPRALILNGFWLVIPILLWNLLFTLPGKYSPMTFWSQIPPLITYGETISRMAIILFPLLLSVGLRRRSQRVGLAIYLVGLAAYAGSWVGLIFFPESIWSTSLIGFLAPTYTPLLWAIGIGLVGDRLHWQSPYRPWIYIAIALIFTVFHVSHTLIVFSRGA
ncbi:MAG TPA: hypothetical protein VF807_12255 [Ktedonobacterales bacterium]